MQLSMFDTSKPVVASVTNCTLIYTPKGRAREYAALACNVYRGCDHRCVYCYAPSATQRSPDAFAISTPRKGCLQKLEEVKVQNPHN